MDRGSLPGTKVVRNATRVPVSATTGTGSRATIVACAMETTLTRRNSSMSPMQPSITASAASSHPGAWSRSVQWLGQISQISSTADSSGASVIRRVARIRCGSREISVR